MWPVDPLDFESLVMPPEEASRDAVRELLESIEPDGMSPRDALEALYKLKGLLK